MLKLLANYWHTLKYIYLTDISEEKHNKHLGSLPTLFFTYSTGLMIFLFSILFVTTTGFFLNIRMDEFRIVGATLLAVLTFFLFTKAVYKKKTFLYFVLLVTTISATVASSTWVAGKFYDLSYDGQAYHQEMMIALTTDWNPISTRLTQYNRPDISYQKILNSYPKASEIMSAVIYAATGQMEGAKGITLIMGSMAFFYTLSFLLRLKKVNLATILVVSLAAVITPITVVQSLSFYLDAQIYLLVVSLLAILGSYFLGHKNYFFYPVLLCLVILWNMKLTAIVTSTIIMLGFLVLVWYHEKILLAFKLALVTGFSAVTALCIVGFNPYITNTLWFGHPLYPAAGSGATDYISGNMPESLYKMNSIERLMVSSFSKTSMVRGVGKEHTLKSPFSFEPRELDILYANNTIGGFGPIFGGVMLTIIYAFVLFAVAPGKKISKRITIFTILIIFLTCIVVPVSSYARYIPQLWLIPCILMATMLMNKNFGLKLVGIVLMLSMAINVCLVMGAYYSYQYTKSQSLRTELTALKTASGSKLIKVDFGAFRSNRVRFKEAGIKFQEYYKGECNGAEKRILQDAIPEALIKTCL